jgi:hypothetical protein
MDGTQADFSDGVEEELSLELDDEPPPDEDVSEEELDVSDVSDEPLVAEEPFEL